MSCISAVQRQPLCRYICTLLPSLLAGVSLSPCVLPQSGGGRLYHTYIILTCSSGALYKSKVDTYMDSNYIRCSHHGHRTFEPCLWLLASRVHYSVQSPFHQFCSRWYSSDTTPPGVNAILPLWRPQPVKTILLCSASYNKTHGPCLAAFWGFHRYIIMHLFSFENALVPPAFVFFKERGIEGQREGEGRDGKYVWLYR